MLSTMIMKPEKNKWNRKFTPPLLLQDAYTTNLHHPFPDVHCRSSVFDLLTKELMNAVLYSSRLQHESKVLYFYFVEWLQSPSYCLHKNPCRKNLDLWPSLERGSCGACCSSVWLMIGPCSLWSMTGPQWASPIATTQMWQADQAGRHWPRWEQDRWEASLQSICHKAEPNRLLKDSL